MTIARVSGTPASATRRQKPAISSLSVRPINPASVTQPASALKAFSSIRKLPVRGGDGIAPAGPAPILQLFEYRAGDAVLGREPIEPRHRTLPSVERQEGHGEAADMAQQDPR